MHKDELTDVLRSHKREESRRETRRALLWVLVIMPCAVVLGMVVIGTIAKLAG